MCRNEFSLRKVEFIKNGKIIKGTICAEVTLLSGAGDNTSYFCRDCIDIFYNKVKMNLTCKLWVLK